MFGYPTGLGAVIIRHSADTDEMMQQRPYFGGGTVAGVVADEPICVRRTQLVAVRVSTL